LIGDKMQYRKIGKSNLHASVIALGTWVMGGWMWGGADDDESINTIHASIDAGINLIDTAPVYGFGRSEEVVGKAIKDRRDKVILATKCGLRWDLDRGILHFISDRKGISKDESAMKVYKYLGAESIREEVERSLKRLQTDYIDVYQTHWQDESTPIEESLAELIKLKEEGKILAIGASNANVEQLMQYRELDVDQEKYNMLERKAEERGNVKYCEENNIAILAYSTLALGLLTGKITTDRKFGEGDLRNNNPMFSAQNIVKVNTMLKEFEEIAAEHNITLSQLVLARTFNRAGVTNLLCGARTVEQALSNAKAGEVELSEEHISELDNIYDRYFGSRQDY
jgi:aryl-alcohol dehydrogenase-like predicted oxidoreductase